MIEMFVMGTVFGFLGGLWVQWRAADAPGPSPRGGGDATAAVTVRDPGGHVAVDSAIDLPLGPRGVGGGRIRPRMYSDNPSDTSNSIPEELSAGTPPQQNHRGGRTDPFTPRKK